MNTIHEVSSSYRIIVVFKVKTYTYGFYFNDLTKYEYISFVNDHQKFLHKNCFGGITTNDLEFEIIDVRLSLVYTEYLGDSPLYTRKEHELIIQGFKKYSLSRFMKRFG